MREIYPSFFFFFWFGENSEKRWRVVFLAIWTGFLGIYVVMGEAA